MKKLNHPTCTSEDKVHTYSFTLMNNVNVTTTANDKGELKVCESISIG